MAILALTPRAVFLPLVVFHSGQTWPGPTSASKIERRSAAGHKVAIALKGNVREAMISPVIIENAYRAIAVDKDATVSELVIDGLQAEVTRGCIDLHGSSIVVRNIRCSMVPGPKTSMRELPTGLQVRRGSDIRIEDSVFNGFQMELGPRQYWNGDGVSVERQVSGLVIHNVRSNNNTDAGFDIKAPVVMNGVSAAGNCRNYRFWSDADVGALKVGDVTWRGGTSRCAGIWIAGSKEPHRPRIRIRNLIVNASKPLTIIKVGNGDADISVDHCSIHAPPGSRMLDMPGGSGSAVLDRSCRI